MTDVLEGFREVLYDKDAVRLFNSFEGITISNTGTVIGVTREFVTINVHRYQLKCVELEQQSVIVISNLTESIIAKPVNIDYREQEVMFSSLRFGDPFSNKRTQIRVNPSKPIKVLFPYRTTSSGELKDISLSGIGILISRAAFNYDALGKGEEILIELALPLSESAAPIPLQLKCQVMNINFFSDNNFYRIGLKPYLNSASQSMITKYVNLRISELLKDLERKCQAEIS